MFTFSAINFDMRDKIKKFNKFNNNNTSAYAFNSLWLWQNYMNFSICLTENAYIIKKNDLINTYFMPQGKTEDVKHLIDILVKDSKSKLLYVTNEDKDRLTLFYPNQWEFVRAEYADEYLIDKNEHIQLYGRKYQNCRRFVHKVLRENSLEVKLLEDNNLIDAETVINFWKTNNNPDADSKNNYEELDLNAIRNFKKLNMTGIILYINGKPVAVNAGYYLSDDSFDLAISKTSEEINGIPYFGKRELMLNLSDNCKLINLEEDLGLDGLRNMKERLIPVSKKYMWEAVRI